MIVKLLAEDHLQFLSLKGGCTGSSESTHVKMPHCWNSHVKCWYQSFTCCEELVPMHSSQCKFYEV